MWRRACCQSGCSRPPAPWVTLAGFRVAALSPYGTRGGSSAMLGTGGSSGASIAGEAMDDGAHGFAGLRRSELGVACPCQPIKHRVGNPRYRAG